MFFFRVQRKVSAPSTTSTANFQDTQKFDGKYLTNEAI